MIANQVAKVVAKEAGWLTLDYQGIRLPWPADSLADVHVGDSIHLIALRHASLEAERAEIAKSLLHELLHPTPTTGSSPSATP